MLMSKRAYIFGALVHSMSWHARVIDEWENAGIIERIAWAFTIFYPILRDMGGYVSAYNIYPVFEIALYVVLVAVILLNIKTRKERDVAQDQINELTKRLGNKELDQLIKPLYLAFDANPTTPKQQGWDSSNYDGLVHLLSMPPNLLNDPVYQKTKKKEVDIVNSVIDIMKRHWEIAQLSRLRDLITQYFGN